MFFPQREVFGLRSGLMVIQVYTKPHTCHLVKYQHLLYSYFTSLRMLYIQAVFAQLDFRLRHMNTDREDRYLKDWQI